MVKCTLCHEEKRVELLSDGIIRCDGCSTWNKDGKQYVYTYSKKDKTCKMMPEEEARAQDQG